MTITIDVPPQAEAGLTQAAKRAGQTPEEVVTETMIRLFGQAEQTAPNKKQGLDLVALLADVVGKVHSQNGQGVSHLAENAEGAEDVPTVGDRLQKYFGIVHGNGTRLPDPAKEFSLFERLGDIIGCVENEDEKHLAGSAETEYHRALVQRHAEGHI